MSVLDAATPTPLSTALAPLLAAGEPPAFSVLRAEGGSAFVLVCDHASARIPGSLGLLGLSEGERASHIAWDIGAAAVAQGLSERLDASLILQNYSRLVVDCNRPPHSPELIATQSEWGQVSGNLHLGAEQVAARQLQIFNPYHAAITTLLNQRMLARKPTILIAVHSFTPVYRGDSRPWHIGLMYRQDCHGLAAGMLKRLRRDERLTVGDNQPYAIDDDLDHTLPLHGEMRGIPHVGIEIRQDLIADEAGQKNWAGRLASLLKQLPAELAAA
ncbi:MAG: N-formylglutamate amidohydrolase [Pseudomonadota bacterium]|jgi:predicted N-formylglutamate amidohydrolase|nr:N-formylglutamate amidohydrolase [Pseudomonadota bacterium]